jgi:succinate dehydrogenase cytochrome b556 subunit
MAETSLILFAQKGENMAERPRNIGLGSLISYRFPVTAIASILHRASGLILFIAIPWILYAFGKSLASAAGFQDIHAPFQARAHGY